MITFKQFINESRSKQISVEQAISWMEENAMDYLNGKTFLFRGIKERAPHITFANTHEGEPRKSIGGMANYYTLWMSYNPEWKDKPRRERSFICSSSESDAATWGILNLIVPSNNSKIGAVGENDIWNIQLHLDLKSVESFSLGRFTSSTRRFLKLFDLAEAHTYEELAKNLKSVTIQAIKEKDEANKYWHGEDDLMRIIKETKVDNLFELWSKVLSPDNFEFMTAKNITGDGEFWIDGQAIYIPLTQRLAQEDAKRLVEWAENHAPHLARLLKHKLNWKDV